MNMLKKSLFAIGTAIMATIIISGSAFADMAYCLHEKNPRLSTKYNVEHKVKCPAVKTLDGDYITLFAETSADCAQVATLASDPDSCLNSPNQVKQEVKTTEVEKVELSAENVEYFKSCIGEGNKYPKLSLEKDEAHPKKCPATTIDKNQIVQFYVADLSDCAEGLTMTIMPHGCADVPDTNTVTTFQPCVGDANKAYPNLSIITGSSEYPIRCPVVEWKGKLIAFFAKTGADCSKTQELVNNSGCAGQSIGARVKNRLFIYIGGGIAFLVISIIIAAVTKSQKKKTAGTTMVGNTPTDGAVKPANPFLEPAKPTDAEWTIKPAEPAAPAEPEAQNYPADQPDNPQNQ